MVAKEVYRYTDARGDTIMFKFDPDLIDHPTEPAITIFHEWRQDLVNKIQWSSILVDREGAIERYAKDRKPQIGQVLYQGRDAQGQAMTCRFVPFDKNPRGYVVEVNGK